MIDVRQFSIPAYVHITTARRADRQLIVLLRVQVDEDPPAQVECFGVDLQGAARFRVAVTADDNIDAVYFLSQNFIFRAFLVF